MQEPTFNSNQSHAFGQSGHNGASQLGSFTSNSLSDLLRDPQGDARFAANAAGFHSRATSRSTPGSDVYLNGRVTGLHSHSDSPLASPLWSPFDNPCPESYTQIPTNSSMRHQSTLDIIRGATEEQLISTQNPAYMRIYQEKFRLVGRIEELEKTYQTLLSATRNLSDPSGLAIEDTPPLNREDYPKIKYWYKNQMTLEKRQREEFEPDKQVQKGRPPKAEAKNVAFWYFQEEDGTELSNEAVEGIRASAKTIWWDLCDQNNRTPIGGPWGKVSPRHQLQYFLRIEAKYPILRLCENHYKAESIPHRDYTHWYSVCLKHYEGKKAEEEAGKADEAQKKSKPQKRTHSASPTRVRKSRRRGESDVDDDNEDDDDEDEYNASPDADADTDVDMRPSQQPRSPVRRSPRRRTQVASIASPMRNSRYTPSSSVFSSARPKSRQLQSVKGKGKAPERRSSTTRRSTGASANSDTDVDIRPPQKTRSPVRRSPQRRTQITSPTRNSRAAPASSVPGPSSSRPKPRPVAGNGKAAGQHRASTPDRSTSSAPSLSGRPTGEPTNGGRTESPFNPNPLANVTRPSSHIDVSTRATDPHVDEVRPGPADNDNNPQSTPAVPTPDTQTPAPTDNGGAPQPTPAVPTPNTQTPAPTDNGGAPQPTPAVPTPDAQTPAPSDSGDIPQLAPAVPTSNVPTPAPSDSVSDPSKVTANDGAKTPSTGSALDAPTRAPTPHADTLGSRWATLNTHAQPPSTTSASSASVRDTPTPAPSDATAGSAANTGDKGGSTTKTKKPAPMRPGTSKTPRNLYAIDYLKDHPTITREEFGDIWDNLDKATKDTYKQRSKDAKK